MSTPAAPDDIAVSHNQPEQRFETRVEGKLSICEYQMDGDRMVFTHTFVPPQLRGKGIAQKLVEVALNYAMAKKLRVDPACSYVEAFIRRRPEYKVMVS
jgi:predicted GNAT family acetyltransferase